MKIIYQNKTSAIQFARETGLWRVPHLHKEIEIIYVRKGTASAYTDKKSYELKEGDLFIALPNQIHYYETRESGEFAVIIFLPKIIYGFGDVLSKSVSDINVVKSVPEDGIRDALEHLWKVSGDYTELAVNGYINVIMSLVFPKLQLRPSGGSENTALNNLIYYCTQNFRENITLDDAAKHLHLSKYYISHLINKELKTGFSEYINSLRVSEACVLLRETDEKIADISEDVGFGTIRSFNRAFKRMLEMSPLEYREKNSMLRK